ncbi:hypothetical protein ACG33_09380 [Steroidobacter denitrificans]|uniref:DUF4845 domain-containing protein n=2 Tax=Steroidobacter denitrificans TaxID=465721 RepID=A0A127FCE7_STEDE|nr:hypothetical protein ACG33_09380 [Steroidobacter denitrificans]
MTGDCGILYPALGETGVQRTGPRRPDNVKKTRTNQEAKQMRDHQSGATFIGMLVIVAILGLGLYGAIRLVPLYMEFMAVARALDQTAKEAAGSRTSPGELRSSLDRRWTIEDITSLQPKEVEIRRSGNGYSMRAWYRAEAPFIGNVSLVVDFDKTVDVNQ